MTRSRIATLLLLLVLLAAAGGADAAKKRSKIGLRRAYAPMPGGMAPAPATMMNLLGMRRANGRALLQEGARARVDATRQSLGLR